MDFFRIVGYTEGFRSYRIGLLAFLALCRKMNSPQILNANPTKSPNLEFGQLVGFRPLHKSRKYWALVPRPILGRARRLLEGSRGVWGGGPKETSEK